MDGVDIQAVVMPFQEIYTVLHDNANSVIDIHYSIDTIEDEEEYPYKMNNLLSAVEISAEGPFAGIYANRMDIDPPGLSAGVGYVLI